MFGKRFKLFEAFGFSVRVDASWFLIVALITWSLATAYFPSQYEGLGIEIRWTMGLAGALGLFLSILLHEFAHAIVAQRYGVPMEGITLFLFGGVAEMKEEPPSAKAEFFIAIAGPIASLAIAGTCYVIANLGKSVNCPIPVIAVLSYLSFINTLLVVFNLIPAFPLDGGRVLRAVLWRVRGSLKSATRTTVGFGEAFGMVLIVLGAISFMTGNFVGGMWQFLIGMFLRAAARMSYQRLLVRQALEGESVERFMETDVISVPPVMSVEQLVEEYVYRFHHKMFPVVEHGELRGCVTTRDIRTIPRDQWRSHTVADIAQPTSSANTVERRSDPMKVLDKMSQGGLSRVMVVEGTRLCGIVTLKDLLRFIELKIELEESNGRGTRI